MKLRSVLATAFCAAVLLSACGEKGINENQPASEIQAQAASMNKAQIEAQIAKIVKVIDSKKADLSKATDDLKNVPLTEMFSDRAKEIKGRVSAATDSINKLYSQTKIYEEELAKKK